MVTLLGFWYRYPYGEKPGYVALLSLLWSVPKADLRKAIPGRCYFTLT